MTDQSCALIIFSKAPIPGTVKTRLIPTLGEEGAANLYMNLLEQTLNKAIESNINDLRLYCTPTTEDVFLEQQAAKFSCTLHLQTGNDLGERMAQALEETLEVYDSALLIGCDCPALSADDLNMACKQLTQDYDLVIGPAKDGGYYLIGLCHPDKRLFMDVKWGESDVLTRTRKRIKELGLKAYELPELWDLDRPEDLSRYKNQ